MHVCVCVCLYVYVYSAAFAASLAATEHVNSSSTRSNHNSNNNNANFSLVFCSCFLINRFSAPDNDSESCQCQMPHTHIHSKWLFHCCGFAPVPRHLPPGHLLVRQQLYTKLARCHQLMEVFHEWLLVSSIKPLLCIHSISITKSLWCMHWGFVIDNEISNTYRSHISMQTFEI